eukprot:scaffold69980_cov35-Attheya_sp.AAC.1
MFEEKGILDELYIWADLIIWRQTEGFHEERAICRRTNERTNGGRAMTPRVVDLLRIMCRTNPSQRRVCG